MKFVKHHILFFLLGLLCYTGLAETTRFRHRGFYMHEGWFFNYPFAVRTWEREDFSKMFHLLQRMGYDQVAIWPMLEAIPMPLSADDSLALHAFKRTIDDAFTVMYLKIIQSNNWVIQTLNVG